MATDNNIKHFTAADIEKYHRGLLSNKEMHDLEKAAMDDPFLADALEGYAVTGVNVGTDITDLQKRLADKTESAKVIVMSAAPRNSFRVLRAAILLAFVAGASLLIYQFGFNNKSAQIAKSETAPKEDKKIIDSPEKNNPETTGTTTSSTPSSDLAAENGKKDLTIKEESDGLKDNVSAPGGSRDEINNPSIVTGNLTVDDKLVNKPQPKQEVVAASPKVVEERSDKYKITEKTPEKKELARMQTENNIDLKAKKDDADGYRIVLTEKAAQQNNRKVALPQKANQQVYNFKSTNLFRGRVTDADNNAVPFANVTNVQDNNAGTYTDANGNFNLIYPDTVLTVQVRSIGFDNTNVQLRNNVANNHVVMQEDRKNLSEVVVSNQKPIVTNRSRAANIKLEEPEPADGWENYDTYVANNLEVPEDVKTKQAGSGAVEVSFEVNKNGQPINIKVEKSLCPKCDEEAKRLIKEGPKWKKNAAKKGKTTVTISF